MQLPELIHIVLLYRPGRPDCQGEEAQWALRHGSVSSAKGDDINSWFCDKFQILKLINFQGVAGFCSDTRQLVRSTYFASQNMRSSFSEICSWCSSRTRTGRRPPESQMLVMGECGRTVLHVIQTPINGIMRHLGHSCCHLTQAPVKADNVKTMKQQLLRILHPDCLEITHLHQVTLGLHRTCCNSQLIFDFYKCWLYMKINLYLDLTMYLFLNREINFSCGFEFSSSNDWNKC